MKAVKIISSVILILLLLTAESFVMGIFSVDRAVSKESVYEAMEESNIVSELVDEALSEETVNMGGTYGDMLDAVFRTQAVKDFLSDYMTAVIDAELYGNIYEEIGSDEFMQAFSEGIDEVNKSGSYNISAMESEFLKQAVQRKAPDLTQKLNSQADRYDSLDGEASEKMADGILSDMGFLSGPVKAVSLLVTALVCAGLIALCWTSKLGFLWCAVVTALISSVFWGLHYLIQGVISISASDTMMYLMIEKGFGSVYTAGFIIAAVFMAAFIIFSIIFRNKKKTTHNENISYTESTHI